MESKWCWLGNPIELFNLEDHWDIEQDRFEGEQAQKIEPLVEKWFALQNRDHSKWFSIAKEDFPALYEIWTLQESLQREIGKLGGRLIVKKGNKTVYMGMYGPNNRWYPSVTKMPCVVCKYRCVTLQGFTNTCDCGADYNGSGQRLAPRSQWGEETGESVSDILDIDNRTSEALLDELSDTEY